MYYRMYQQTINPEDGDLDSLEIRLNQSFEVYKKNHKDLCVKVEKDEEHNQIKVTAIFLEGELN